MAKVAFIQDELRTREGIMILSAVLKKHGHETDVFSKVAEKDLIKSVFKYNPDLIALSSSTYEHKFSIECARRIKQINPSKFIIMGGPHPTFFPEVIDEKSLDAICIGEGEEALVELADALGNGHNLSHIQNLWVREDGKVIKNPLRPLIDLNTLPSPDREIYYKKYSHLKEEDTKIFIVGRGCPYDCSYCFNHVQKEIYKGKGSYIRFKAPEKVIKEIQYVNDHYGIKWAQFNDDTINTDKKWLLNFLDLYKRELAIPFICNVRVDNINEEMVIKLKEAGINRVNFGVEHGNEEFRKKYLKRTMTNQQLITVGKLFKKHKIRTLTANMVGFPHETIQLALETIKINRAFMPEWASCHVLQPYPKTKIYEYAQECGFLSSDYTIEDLQAPNTWNADLKVTGSVINQSNINRLVNLHCFFDLLVKHYWLLPFIYPLLYLPPNRLFESIWQLPYFTMKMKFAKTKEEKRTIRKKFFSQLIK